MSLDTPPSHPEPNDRPTESRPAKWTRLHPVWKILIVLTVAGCLAVAAIGITLVRALRLDHDLVELRDATVAGYELNLRPEFQGSAGSTILSLARLALVFAPSDAGIPSYARDAVSAVRHVSVGVYKLDDAPDLPMDFDGLESIERKMAKSGWETLVRVRDGDDLVLIMVRGNSETDDEMELCLSVRDQTELVVLGTRLNTEKVIKVAQAVIAEERVVQQINDGLTAAGVSLRGQGADETVTEVDG